MLTGNLVHREHQSFSGDCRLKKAGFDDYDNKGQFCFNFTSERHLKVVDKLNAYATTQSLKVEQPMYLRFILVRVKSH